MKRAKHAVSSKVVLWALNRAGVTLSEASKRLPPLNALNKSLTVSLTARQLEKLCTITRQSAACFFENEPPPPAKPIADFRTIGGRGTTEYSLDLEEMVKLCLCRRDFCSEIARKQGLPAASWQGRHIRRDDPVKVAAEMRSMLGLGKAMASKKADPTRLFRQLSAALEDQSVLVFKSRIAGGNARRRLSVDEFRGFAICDKHAPLIFINDNDTPRAKLFTLMHEFAHLLLGEGGVSNPSYDEEHGAERWCNQFAAAFLMPEPEIRSLFPDFTEDAVQAANDVSRLFGVSPTAALIRIRELGLTGGTAYDEARSRFAGRQAEAADDGKPGGHPSYSTVAYSRLSPSFVRMVSYAVDSGDAVFTEAFRLMGVKSIGVYETLCKKAYDQGARINAQISS